MSQGDNIKKPLKSWLDDFHEDSGTISDLTRKLDFAGIALIWIFKNTDLTEHILPGPLVTPLRFIVIALILDVLQYIWRAVAIFICYSIKESKYDKGKLNDTDIEDVKVPDFIPGITWLFFWAKIASTAIAYYFIYDFIVSKL